MAKSYVENDFRDNFLKHVAIANANKTCRRFDFFDQFYNLVIIFALNANSKYQFTKIQTI